MSVLIYIEYISRRPGIGLDAFHKVAGLGQTGWSGGYQDDTMILNVGRSWRIGPEPEYMCVWYSPSHGLERIDEWERTFRSGEADVFEQPFRIAARIDQAGCYTPLLEPVVGTAGRYYAEYFDFSVGADHGDVRGLFAERCQTRPGLELNLLVDRIGRLGPDPRGLAVWSLPRWGDVGMIAQDLDGTDSPIRLVSASLLADFGQEQI